MRYPLASLAALSHEPALNPPDEPEDSIELEDFDAPEATPEDDDFAAAEYVSTIYFR